MTACTARTTQHLNKILHTETFSLTQLKRSIERRGGGGMQEPLLLDVCKGWSRAGPCYYGIVRSCRTFGTAFVCLSARLRISSNQLDNALHICVSGLGTSLSLLQSVESQLVEGSWTPGRRDDSCRGLVSAWRTFGPSNHKRLYVAFDGFSCESYRCLSGGFQY